MRRTLLVALLLLSLCACGSSAPVPRSTPAFGVALDGYPVTAAMLEAAKTSTGLPVRLAQFYVQWPEGVAGPWDADMASLDASLKAVRDSGAVPCITWEPMSIGQGGSETAIPAASILAGEYDAYMADFARRVREFGSPVLLRLAHEMNLARYHWGSDASGYGPESPTLYQALFRHVRAVFRAQGAENALFVFCPNVDSIPAAAWNTATAYYPGHDSVDVLGMDGYNWGTAHTKAVHGYDSSFRPFAEIFRPLYDELRSLAPGKPVMVFETASASAGGDKARWAVDAFDTAAAWGLWSVVWFEVDKELDWPLCKNAATDPALGVRPHVTNDPAWLARLLGARP